MLRCSSSKAGCSVDATRVVVQPEVLELWYLLLIRLMCRVAECSCSLDRGRQSTPLRRKMAECAMEHAGECKLWVWAEIKDSVCWARDS
jgi:hypothetical protein